jgi:hypothetical protein
VHDLDLTRDRVAVFWEMFANLCSRFVDTLAAHNATAGMNPKAVLGIRLREHCGTLEGIELYKILKLRIRSSEEVAFINGSFLNIVQDNLTR